MFRSEKLSHQKKAKYADEKGMYLEVTPSGGMHWRMRFRFNGKRWNQSQRGQKAKKLHADENTLFKALAMEWMEDRKPVIKETTYLRDLSVFEKDLFLALGNIPIDQIKGKGVLTCAKKIEARGAHEMAKRSIPLTGRIFRFAIRKGLIENDPIPNLQEALKPRKEKHMARLDISEFQPFLERMDRYHGNPIIKTAIQLMTLTFVRTSELRMMEWDEIDFDNKLLIV